VVVDHGLQFLQAAQLDLVRGVIVQVGRRRAGARAEDEAEAVVETLVVGVYSFPVDLRAYWCSTRPA
jgi:hypothetical protein